MPTLKELAKHDPALKSLLTVGSIFIIGPPIFIYWEDPYGWEGKSLLPLYALVAPLLVIIILSINRWRKLTRLSDVGRWVEGIVEKTFRRSAIVRFTLEGTEHRVTLEVPARLWDIDDGAAATLLIDPSKPNNATLLEVRGVLSELRSKLGSRGSTTEDDDGVKPS